jgi:hypothetical protein
MFWFYLLSQDANTRDYVYGYNFYCEVRPRFRPKEYETEITDERINAYLAETTGNFIVLDLAGYLRKHDKKRWNELRLLSAGFTTQRHKAIDERIAKANKDARERRVEALAEYYAKMPDCPPIRILPFVHVQFPKHCQK